MKDKIVEILRDEFLTEISLDEIYQRSAERIDQLYSAGEDVSDDDIMEELSRGRGMEQGSDRVSEEAYTK